MRIDEQARQCVSFLVHVDKADNGSVRQFVPVGTAFYVGINVGRDRWIKYAITARHVIESSRSEGALYVRCIGKNGKKKLFQFPQDHWWVHPSSDVAAVRVGFPLEDYGLRFLPTDLFATDDWMRLHDVGIGDRLIMSGMFSQFIGDVRDEPLVRFGQISLMPKDKVRIPSDSGMPEMEIDAIFVEAAAWGGQSGSPVFVYFSVERGLFAGQQLQMRIPNPRLLGLVHGYVLVHQPVNSNLEVPLNAGIAVVIPSKSISELLMSDRVVEDASK